eukprot:2249475-Alexandrium_andersonii.AAC.1
MASPLVPTDDVAACVPPVATRPALAEPRFLAVGIAAARADAWWSPPTPIASFLPAPKALFTGGGHGRLAL